MRDRKNESKHLEHDFGDRASENRINWADKGQRPRSRSQKRIESEVYDERLQGASFQCG